MNFALLLVLAAAPAPQSWQFQTDGTPEGDISNVNGSVRVEAVDGKTVSWRYAGGQRGRVARNTPGRGQPGRGRGDGADVLRAVRGGGLLQLPRPGAHALRGEGAARRSLRCPRWNAPVTVAGVAGDQELSVVSGDVSVKGSG